MSAGVGGWKFFLAFFFTIQYKHRLQVLDHSNEQFRGVSSDLFLAFSPDETSLCSAYKYIISFSQLVFLVWDCRGVLGAVLKGKEKAELLGEASAAFAVSCEELK